MYIDINLSTLDEKTSKAVRAFGHLSGAWLEASRAESALQEDIEEFRDEFTAINNANIALKFIRAGLAFRLEAIARGHGAGVDDYARFVDDEGETVASIYVQ